MEIELAKRKADELCLAFWPAIAFGPEIDPTAYAIAEKVRHAKSKIPIWKEGESTGVWDIFEKNGMSPQAVAEYWQASGFKDTPKFRAQVISGIPGKRSQSLRRYLAYARGARWVRREGVNLKLSTKAIEALGMLSAPLRRAALLGVKRKDKPVRIRDLNWTAVTRASKALATGHSRVLAALSAFGEACRMNGIDCSKSDARQKLVGKFVPQYPKIDLETARRIVIGESPVETSGGLLTRKEAHQWLLDGKESIPWWLSRHLELPYHRSVRVLRWLKYQRDTGRWDSLSQPHEMLTPYGVRMRSAFQVLDEIQDEDIQSGRECVATVMQRVAQRTCATEKAVKNLDEPLAPMPAWARNLPKGIRILRTPGELLQEGNEMRHCVGTYTSAVKKGQCHILSVSTRYGRSTVELSPDLRVIQHRGPENSDPPARNDNLLRAFLNRIHRQKALAAA